jgi:hypothetical protein
MLLSLINHQFVAGHKKVYIEQKASKKADLVIIGSSRAEHAIDPRLFDPNYTVYNFAMAGHGLPSNYLLLKMLVEKHQYSIGQVLLSADELNFNGTVALSRKFRDDFFVGDIHDKEVYEAYQKYRGNNFAMLLKSLPEASTIVYSDITRVIKNAPFAFHPLSSRYREKQENEINEEEQMKGYKPVFPTKKIHGKEQKTNYVIEEDDLYYFNKIVELCNKNKIKLTLFRAPILHCDAYGSQAFDAFITSFVNQHNIAFYDYKCQYQLPDQYYDNTHAADSICQVMTKDLRDKIQPVLAEQRSREENGNAAISKLR